MNACQILPGTTPPILPLPCQILTLNSGHNQPALVAELIVWGGQMFQVLKVIKKKKKKIKKKMKENIG